MCTYYSIDCDHHRLIWHNHFKQKNVQICREQNFDAGACVKAGQDMMVRVYTV